MREEWRKDCGCRAGAVTNDMSVSTARQGDSIQVIATFQLGPVCVKCGRPWVRGLVPGSSVVSLSDRGMVT